jgi:hypothetical protein
MAVGEYIICEPLRVWNRLEPRARKADFSRVLRAEIADPAWMLGRQWQFGELKGEDTGSAVLAKVATRSARINAVRAPGGPFEPHLSDRPLETRVEREAPHVDLRLRAEMGRHLLAIADDAGVRHDAAGMVPPYDRSSVRTMLRTHYGFRATPETAGSSPREQVEHLRVTTNVEVLACIHALANRGVDGWAVLQALPGAALTTANLPGSLFAALHPAHVALWLESLTAFRVWFVETYGQGSLPTWLEGQLEYSFAAQLPRPNGGTLTLEAPEYHGGHLDWDAFEQGPLVVGTGGPDLVERKVATMIPAPAQYPGMPHPRFWQMEDGAVNLGALRADTTDIVKVVVAEFALLFGNDWFVFPLGHPVGSLVEVEGIVVTDVFGQRTLIESATPANSEGWARWAFFELSSRTGSTLGAHLFIPPAVAEVHESDPVEAITILRDESANMVWGIERIVPDGLGGGRDAVEASRRLERALRVISPLPPAGSEGVTAELSYQLGTGVPENWIPFIPVHQPRDDRAIRLQRASMPRFAFDTVRPVRPQTRILRPGLSADDQQTSPYFIHEEEVPRGGVRVEATMQRTRWFDGRAHLWVGRRKKSGRGEGSSSLRFDVLTEKTPPNNE